MKKIPLICLCLISLLIVMAACLTLTHVKSSQNSSLSLSTSMHRSAAQGSSIWFNDTDYNYTTASAYPNLGNITKNVTRRMIVEYADHGIQQSMQVPAGLPSIFPIGIIIEYADTSSLISLQRPETLNQTVAPRIIVEYADYATTLTLSPYLGPPPYQSDTSPPSIIVTREPSGAQVQASESVNISTNVTDLESGVKNATLQYTLGNSTDWFKATVKPMSLNLTLKPQNSLALSFNATIPPQPSGTRVRFRIVAYDFAGNNATSDGMIGIFTYVTVPEFPSFLVLPLLMTATILAVVVFRRKHSV